MIARPETRKLLGLGVVIGLTIACNIFGSDPQSAARRAAARTPLPTLTPTVATNSVMMPQETNLATTVVSSENVVATPTPDAATATLLAPVAPDSEKTTVDVPTPTPALSNDTATLEPTAIPPGVSGWSFTNMHAYPSPYDDGLLVYGDIVNNTGTTQELVTVSGTIFDAQGQVVAGTDDIVDYWPFDIVPVGGQLPFELTVLDVQQAADFDLFVDSRPGDQTPHQNFNVINVEQLQEDGVYCLLGELENRGDFLNEYVIILAVLFDDQNQMLSFGEYYEPEPEAGLTEFPLEFDICVDVAGQNVARYEVRAWGQ